MSKVVFFCDEDIPDALIAWLCKLEPAMLIESVLIWSASAAAEWLDRLEFIPW